MLSLVNKGGNRMKLRYVYRSLLFVIGLFFILLGFIGLLLPVVPQVPFFIVGAICLMKSSDRIKYWVKDHRLDSLTAYKLVKKEKLNDIELNSPSFGISNKLSKSNRKI